MSIEMATDHATPRSFMVEVSSELLAQLLDEWSEPVQIQIQQDAHERGGYRLTARRCGGNAAERTAPAVPATDAARAHAAGPATPTPPRPQGVAGHPPARESRK